jgi:hypothetical protein
MNTQNPPRHSRTDIGRLYRVRLLIVLAALSVPTAAVRGAVAVAKAALLDGRTALCHGGETVRVLASLGE